MQNKIGVSVEEILNLDILKGSQVLGGRLGLDRPVTTVNVMEVPDIVDWLKPGEFLLTTAYSIRNNIHTLLELIPKMNDIGVSGLGIKVKRYVDELPQSVIALSERLNFPIIQMPLEVSFGDVIMAVLTTVINKQTDLLLQIDAFNNRLKDIMLGGGDLKDIAAIISQLVDAPVAITEALFKDYVLVCSASERPDLSKLAEELLIKKTEGFSRFSKPKGITTARDLVLGKSLKRWLIPIYSDDMMYGHVMIWDKETQIAEKKLFMIEAAASLIALNSAKKMSVYENENKHKIEFIEELLSTEEQHRLRALEKANYFNFDKNKAYGVVLVKLDDASHDIRMTPNNSHILKQLNAKLVSVVERMHRLYKGHMLYANKSNRAIFLLGFDGYEKEALQKKHMVSFADELMGVAHLESIGQSVNVGIGRVYPNCHQTFHSLLEAERAIQKMLLKNGQSRVLHFDDLGIYRILSNETIQPELIQFFNETLGAIARYDQEKDAELLSTLKMFFSCGCNLKKVSEEMYTHYNTIIYRMQRIKEIGNMDLNDPNVALNVHIAIKILDLIPFELNTPKNLKRR